MVSTLKAQLADAVKSAMRAKQTARLGTLRFLQAAVKQKEIDGQQELSDAEVIAIIEKQVKQRRESIAAFERAGRTETAQQETAELAVLQEFLPEAADDAEIDAAITYAIAQVQAAGTTGPAAMGKVMGNVKAALAGRVDMTSLSAKVKAKLKP